MISEQQQEQASLYALGLLDAGEADTFERDLAADPALHRLVRELQEAAAALALADDQAENPVPSRALRAQVLELIARERSGRVPQILAVPEPVEATRILRSPFGWVPWATAALLLGCCVLLGLERRTLRQQLDDARHVAAAYLTPPTEDALSRVAFCELEPTPEASVRPRAAILWDAAEHKGVLHINRFAPPANGKDYQLWTVEVARKEPVNAGVVHVDTEGHADLSFQPESIPGDNKVVAVAISLEEAGGSPTNKGPILFLGKL